MKTIYKTIITLALLVIPAVVSASAAKPTDVDDTIPATPRYGDYYYTKWFDECPNYYPDGIVDSCFDRYFEFWNFYGDASVAKWEHTKHRMRVKGLVAMVDRYLPPTNDSNPDPIKLPEYLYLYQLVGRHYCLLQSLGIEDGLDLVLVDSVRWDTAHARVMELRRGKDTSNTQYCYLYEAYFENPVYVDSDFYIYGSTNSNVFTEPGSHIWKYAPTIYVDIMDWGGSRLDSNCDSKPYEALIYGDLCVPQGGWVALIDCLMPQEGWYTPWPDSPWGYYLPIVDQWNLEAVPDYPQSGEVIGGGRWPDDSYDTIEAIPAFGYYFDSWSDGSTENPRVIHLTSDTLFVAVFSSTPWYTLTVSSSDESKGDVGGGGYYPVHANITITAEPFNGYKFSHWSDGVTDNPRVVHLVSDTAFVAFFAEKEYFTLQTATNNGDWGSVEGGGVFMEGEDATLTVTTEPYCIFEGWSDGDWHMPRLVTVTQDTLFTAILSFDSSSLEGLDKAGSLAFTVSPNPTTGRLSVQMGQSGNCVVTLYDIHGRALVSRKEVQPTFEIDLGKYAAGKYLLVIRAGESYGIRTIVKK